MPHIKLEHRERTLAEVLSKALGYPCVCKTLGNTYRNQFVTTWEIQPQIGYAWNLYIFKATTRYVLDVGDLGTRNRFRFGNTDGSLQYWSGVIEDTLLAYGFMSRPNLLEVVGTAVMPGSGQDTSQG